MKVTYYLKDLHVIKLWHCFRELLETKNLELLKNIIDLVKILILIHKFGVSDVALLVDAHGLPVGWPSFINLILFFFVFLFGEWYEPRFWSHCVLSQNIFLSIYCGFWCWDPWSKRRKFLSTRLTSPFRFSYILYLMSGAGWIGLVW